MTTGLFTPPGTPQVLETTLSMPYRLTTGGAVGNFLSALAERRILGSRCDACARVAVPAQDYCVDCGAESLLVAVGSGGTVTAATTTPERTYVLVRLDGADGVLLHRLVGGGDVAVGDRVEAVWAPAAQASILDIEGFAPVAEGGGDPAPAVEAGGPVAVDEPIKELPYSLDLHYRHSYGPFYGRLFDELGTYRRILGSPCPACGEVLVPPRARCDVCFAKTDRLVEVRDTGTLQAFSIIHLEFVGQTRQPPYVYAEIILDGCATRLIHTVAGFDIAEAKDILSIGMPVRAVWNDDASPQGSLTDIAYFEPIR